MLTPKEQRRPARGHDGGEARARASSAGGLFDSSLPVAELEHLLDLVDQAVLVGDARGRLRWCNAPAVKFFPALRLGEALPEPMSRDSARDAACFQAEKVGGRMLSGQRFEPTGLQASGCHVWMVRDDGAAAERRQSSGHITRRAEFLAEAGRRLGASLHPDRSARAVVEAAVPILADDAVLFWPVRGPRAGWHRAGSERASGQLAVAEMERTPALAKALRGLRAQPERCGVRELSAPADVMGLWPDGDGQALVVALPGTGMPCGVLVLARGPGRPGFDDDDVGLAQEFAVRAGAALAAAALYTEQVAAASALQDELVPDTLPDVVGVRLGAVYRPAREELRVSGDFYQVRPGRADGGADFVFGDVCGSGVEAAVIGRRVRHSLRSLAVVENRPVAVLRLLNEALVQDGVASFATVILGSVRPARDGGRDLVMAGGGHLPPLVLRGDGRIEEVEVGGMLVGAVPEADFDEAAVHLAAGESILLYSDGITEARGGPTGHEMYGEPRLRHGLATCAGMPAGAVVERLDLLLGHWLAGRPHDDLAMLVIQALERGPSGPSGSADDRPSS